MGSLGRNLRSTTYGFLGWAMQWASLLQRRQNSRLRALDVLSRLRPLIPPWRDLVVVVHRLRLMLRRSEALLVIRNVRHISMKPSLTEERQRFTRKETKEIPNGRRLANVGGSADTTAS